MHLDPDDVCPDGPVDCCRHSHIRRVEVGHGGEYRLECWACDTIGPTRDSEAEAWAAWDYERTGGWLAHGDVPL